VKLQDGRRKKEEEKSSVFFLLLPDGSDCLIAYLEQCKKKEKGCFSSPFSLLSSSLTLQGD